MWRGGGDWRSNRKDRRMEQRGMSIDKAQAYWKKTSTLMWTILAIWFVFGFLIHFLAPTLNQIHILGFPMGFYMAAQGSLIVFVVLCFWNAFAQDKIDEEFGVGEE
jgi:putative solute:sodium symporter small subunit